MQAGEFALLGQTHGEIRLLLIYAKNVQDNIPGHVLRQIKQEIEDA